MSLFTRKTFESVREIGAASGLSKTLGAMDLILFGLGSIIGTGVFVYTGLVAAQYSGPAVMLSYGIAGIACIFVALAYSELATMLPTSGSIYTYSYVAFGKLFAWVMGGVLVLELGLSSAVVAAAWSGYIQAIAKTAGFPIPEYLTKVPSEGGEMNVPAFLIVAYGRCELYIGTKDSKKLNAILVFVKMAAIFAFVLSATPHFDATNWDNFMPFGFDNVLIGSSILFFAFTGFGTIAAAAEECKNPKRDLIIGIVGSLVLSTIVYVIVGGLATGIVSYEHLNNASPLAHALTINNSNIGSAIVATGAVCGMTTVIMMNIYGISRIFYVIARDGMLPKFIAKLHPKHDSPYISIILFSLLAGLFAAFAPFQVLGQLVSMGAIIDYIVVSIIVMLFRYTLPNAPRPFKCPALFIIAPIALCACVYLLFKQILGADGSLLITGELLIYWFAIILVLYFVRSIFMKNPTA